MVDVPTLIAALGAAGVFTLIGQLVQSYLQRRQGQDAGHVDIQAKKLGDAAAFRQELQQRDTELNARIDVLRKEVDDSQTAYHEATSQCAILREQNKQLQTQIELLKEENARLRSDLFDCRHGRAPKPPGPHSE